MITIYSVCSKCGVITKKDQTTANEGETDSITYVKDDNHNCGLDLQHKNKKQREFR